MHLLCYFHSFNSLSNTYGGDFCKNNDLKKLAKNVLMYRKCFCMFGNNFILKNYIDQLPMYHVSNYQLLSFSCKKSKKSGRISENHLQRDFFGMHVGLNSCANIR